MVVEAWTAPVRVIVTPLPLAAGLIVPVMLRVGGGELLCELEKPTQPTLASAHKQRITRSTLAREVFSFTRISTLPGG